MTAEQLGEPAVAKADLNTAKRAAGRHQDLADVEQLEALGESPEGRDDDSSG